MQRRLAHASRTCMQVPHTSKECISADGVAEEHIPLKVVHVKDVLHIALCLDCCMALHAGACDMQHGGHCAARTLKTSGKSDRARSMCSCSRLGL